MNDRLLQLAEQTRPHCSRCSRIINQFVILHRLNYDSLERHMRTRHPKEYQKLLPWYKRLMLGG